MLLHEFLQLPEEALSLADLERRSQPRFICYRRPLVRFLIKPSFESHRAFLQEVSPNGVRLLFTRPLDVGTILAIQLPSGSTGLSHILSAQVKYAIPEQDHGWRLGCRLSRSFTDAELLALR